MATEIVDTNPFPRPSRRVSERLTVIDIHPTLPRWEKFAAVCFQGLANRNQGRVYLQWDETDPHWLRLWGETGYVIAPDHQAIRAIPELIQTRFADCVRGILIYDEEVIDSQTFSFDLDTTVGSIKENTAEKRPAFLRVLCVNWHHPTATLAAMVEKLGKDHVIVDAETLGELYAEFRHSHKTGQR